MLLSALKLFDNPLALVFLKLVFCRLTMDALRYLKCGTCGVFGEVEFGLKLSCSLVSWTSSFDFESELKFVIC